ncbi:MAG TPA: acetyltransferase [Saprospiraceae bacterium]|nr:acetyltransferase [Saprospiraceae bacterium]HNT22551.1 acetyltransferase [Saprospiraceae bacterium]
MVIAGAGGHAREILTEWCQLGDPSPLWLYDPTRKKPLNIYGFEVLFEEDALRKALETDNRFILGVGDPLIREKFFRHFTALAAHPHALISKHALISPFEVVLGQGLNIMANAYISASVSIGDGCLVNAQAHMHHGSRIGRFCTLSPGCKVLGQAIIDDFTEIGSNAVVLPGLQIGRRVRIGAGAVVTKDVPGGVTVKGIPGRW